MHILQFHYCKDEIHNCINDANDAKSIHYTQQYQGCRQDVSWLQISVAVEWILKKC